VGRPFATQLWTPVAGRPEPLPTQAKKHQPQKRRGGLGGEDAFKKVRSEHIRVGEGGEKARKYFETGATGRAGTGLPEIVGEMEKE